MFQICLQTQSQIQSPSQSLKTKNRRPLMLPIFSDLMAEFQHQGLHLVLAHRQ